VGELEIDIFIPTSFTSNLPSLIQRTLSIASIARAAAIFGVDTIYIYPDPLERDPTARKQIIKILRYLNTAPYLRKYLFSLDRDLEHVGLAPPLRTPLHKEKVPIKDLDLPDYREGVVLRSVMDKSVVDVGLDKEVLVNKKFHRGKHVLVKITKVSSKYLHGEVVDRGETPIYPGYKVVNVKVKLPEFLRKYDGKIIFTSRKGESIEKLSSKIKEVLSRGRVGLVFGGPRYGVFEILEYYNSSPYDYSDIVVNVVPNQNVATIRVEEAVIITLSIFNYLKIGVVK